MGRSAGSLSSLVASIALLSCGQHTSHPAQLGDTVPDRTLEGGATGSGSRASSGSGEGGVSAPGSLAVVDGGVCAAIAPTTLVTQEQVAQPTPQATGGTIEPGTYYLTSMNKYTGTGGATGPTSKVLAAAFAFDSSSYQRAVAGVAQDGGLGYVSSESGRYTVSGSTFTENATCGIGNIPVSYSVGPGVVKQSFVNEEYVYTRQ